MALPIPRWWWLWLIAATTTHAGSFTFDNGLILTVPDGLEIERVAGPPLIDRPVMGDFDHHGRLYVAEASGSNDDVKTQLRDKPHRIVCLEDRDDDGRYEHKTTFADRLMLPEGVLCHRGAVYVSAPPIIWKLTDTDADGVCDRREVWHDGKTLTGCANDLHGPYLGPDGWIYWCKGAFAEQTYAQPGKAPFVSRAAHIFRKHPNGDIVEPVMTGGMDNPVEVVFSPSGERFFTTTFLQHPAAGKRDGIIHAIYGGVYGKDHNVITGHPRTGPLMPVMTHLGPAAACGLMRYESSTLGDGYRGNLFATAFNMRKITRHQLKANGATFSTQDKDFLVANQMDFHPTDVLEDGDGSLLVIDTGGWYKLCCPTSQLHKPQVLGGIYRVRRIGQPPVQDPYGRAIQWDQLSETALAKLLEDERHLVRKRAIDTLAKGGEPSIGALAAVLASHPQQEVVQHALWALTQIDSPKARAAVRNGLSHADSSVRQTALHSVSVRQDRQASLRNLLLDPNLAVRRAAAEAAGRIQATSSIDAVLDSLTSPHDRVLEHSLIFALIEMNQPAAIRQASRATTAPAAQRACLIALDQGLNAGIQLADVLPFLNHDDARLRNTAWTILISHPDWAEAARTTIEDLLAKHSPIDHLVSLLGSWSEEPLISTALQSEDPEVRKIARLAISQASPKRLPAAWQAPIERLLTSDLQAALTVLAKIPSSKEDPLPASIQDKLHHISNDPQAPAQDRLRALRLVTRPGGDLTPELFHWLVAQLEPSQPAAHRSHALAILAAVSLPDAFVESLCRSLAIIGPMEFGGLVEILKPHMGDAQCADSVVASLNANPVVASLPSASLNPILEALPVSMTLQKAALQTRFQANQAAQATHLEALLEELPPGDVVRGQAIFNGNRAACATCHEIGYLGGNLGPDLTTIGTIRSRRDLLEAIVFPSASFVRSYESVMVQLKDDQVVLGILKQDGDELLTFATGPASTATVKRQDIVSMSPASVSLMPPGLDTVLTKAELGDLLAFLENTKWR